MKKMIWFVMLLVVLITLTACKDLFGVGIKGIDMSSRDEFPVNSEKPILLIPSYAYWKHIDQFDPAYPEDDKMFEGKNTPRKIWNAVPQSLKDNGQAVLLLHPNGTGGTWQKTRQRTQDKVKPWIESQLAVAQELNAPTVILVYSAWKTYLSCNYLEPKGKDEEWLKTLKARFPVLKGFISTENSHALHETVSQEQWKDFSGWCVERHTQWVEFCGQNGLKFFIFDGGSSFADYYNKTTPITEIYEQDNTTFGRGSKEYCLLPEGTAGQNFCEAVKKYPEALVYSTKNTLSTELPFTRSLALGSYLAGGASAFGVLVDTWSWGTRRLGTLGNKKYSGDEDAKRILVYPEALIAIELANMYMNGGSVATFEAPSMIYGAYGRRGEVLENVITPFFNWMNKYPGPTREQMKNASPVILTNYARKNPKGGDDKAVYPSDMLRGNNDDISVEGGNHDSKEDIGDYETLCSGQYGIIPIIPEGLPSNDLPTKTENSWNQTWNSLFPSITQETGYNKKTERAFVAKRTMHDKKTMWFFYNWYLNKWNKDEVNQDKARQYAKIKLGNTDKTLEISMLPHTLVMVRDDGINQLDIWMTNYRLSKDDAVNMSGSDNYNESTIQDFIYENLCVGSNGLQNRITPNIRNTIFKFTGLTNGIHGNIVDNQKNGQIHFIEDKNTSTLTVRGNGWVNFTIVY